jgi:small-conductance mechanosensitive channel
MQEHKDSSRTSTLTSHSDILKPATETDHRTKGTTMHFILNILPFCIIAGSIITVLGFIFFYPESREDAGKNSRSSISKLRKT